LNSKQYEKLEVLGKGGTSKVYKVRSLSDRKAYALKKVSFDQFDESCVRGFKGEIDLLTKLKHEPRVVSLIDHASSAGSLYLLMECGDLDLAHALQKRMYLDTKLDPNFVRFHASEVFQCIQAVHNAGVVHSDLKPANFLFVDGILKIIDFGIANAVPDHTVNIYRNSQIGTPNYMAPEALVEVNSTLSLLAKNAATTWRVGRPSDIWSCGCIIYQMIYGRPPYASYSGQQRIMAIMNPQVKVLYPATGLGGVRVPASAITLMKKCLERNPSDRWTVEECLHCDFLKPKAVDEHFVKDLLHNAVTFVQRNTHPGSIDEKTYTELVDTILGQIKDLN
ncbi:kinase-like protein, partial [Metschnikowia bicuspidata var. bicuspidata NRRL YB-4993]